MTTTLDNVQVVARPYYYLMAESENSQGSAELTNSNLKQTGITAACTSCKFNLTKGDLSTGESGLIRINTQNIAQDTLYFRILNGKLVARYTTKQYTCDYALELNKWYVLNITCTSTKVNIEICDENGTQLATYLFSAGYVDYKMQSVVFYVGGNYGVLTSRDSKVINKNIDKVIADLSDLLWDWIDSFGTTNAI